MEIEYDYYFQLFGGKKGLSLDLTSYRCFLSLFLTNWLDLTKTIIPLALMASELIAHEAEGLMGY